MSQWGEWIDMILINLSRKRRRRLRQSDVDELCLKIQEYFATQWTDEDNPNAEFKTASSPFLAVM